MFYEYIHYRSKHISQFVLSTDACDTLGQLRHGDVKPDKNFYDINEQITLSCGKKYELIGNKTLTCTNTCEWDSGMPECQSKYCNWLYGFDTRSSHLEEVILGVAL